MKVRVTAAAAKKPRESGIPVDIEDEECYNDSRGKIRKGRYTS